MTGVADALSEGAGMETFDQLDELKQDLEILDWDAIEAKYRALAADEAGSKVAKQVAEVDLTAYQSELAECLSQALEAARDSDAEAVYFEYDMDNDWSGWFFVCESYNAEGDCDDEWATEYDEEVEGPSLPAFAKLFSKHGGMGGQGGGASVTAYLVARTVASLGRCVQQTSKNGVAVCMGFHDQDPVWRLHKPEDGED
jgi:hypothetical protein